MHVVYTFNLYFYPYTMSTNINGKHAKCSLIQFHCSFMHENLEIDLRCELNLQTIQFSSSISVQLCSDLAEIAIQVANRKLSSLF